MNVSQAQVLRRPIHIRRQTLACIQAVVNTGREEGNFARLYPALSELKDRRTSWRIDGSLATR